MDRNHEIILPLDDDRLQRLEQAGLSHHISEVEGKKALKVPLPQKNQRKFKKAFPKTVLNEQTGQVDNFPEDAAAMLLDTIIEHKTPEVMHLFLLKTYKPLAGRAPRQKVH